MKISLQPAARPGAGPVALVSISGLGQLAFCRAGAASYLEAAWAAYLEATASFRAGLAFCLETGALGDEVPVH